MLSNTVALVTGGSSGLGAAAVGALSKLGAKVMIADLSFEGDQVNDELSESIRFFPTDVTDPSQVSASLDEVERIFMQPVNVVVNCAGIATPGKTLSKNGPLSVDDFSRVLHVNTIGTFNVASLAADRMSKRSTDANGLRGAIINTASIAAYEGQIGQVAYSASKGAITSMTLPMARDLSRYGIRVMTIAPGLFSTPLLEGLPDRIKNDLSNSVPCPNRLGNPHEFGSLVSHIVSNPYLNGSVIRLDGALRMPP